MFTYAVLSEVGEREINEDSVTVSLLDVQNKKKISVVIDREENKYSSIDGERAKEV